MRKVLFVCTANVCRSPMAEAVFDALAGERGLNLRAESAGVRALKGEPMVPNASAALEEIGVHAEGHRARQVSKEMLEEAAVVLTMEPRHVAELRQVYGAPWRSTPCRSTCRASPPMRESRTLTGAP